MSHTKEQTIYLPNISWKRCSPSTIFMVYSISGSLSFWLAQGSCCVWISLKFIPKQFIIFYVLGSFIICVKTPCWLGNDLFLVVTFLYFANLFSRKVREICIFNNKKKSPLLWDQIFFKEKIDINTGYHVLKMPSTHQLSSGVP